MTSTQATKTATKPRRAVGRQPRPAVEPPALPPMQERVTFQLHRANAMLAQVCNPIFQQYDIDLVSSRILVALLEHKSMRVGDLVGLMVLPQSTISHQLQRLQRRGLIERSRTVSDNRAVEVTLSASGRRTASVCSDLSRQIYTALSSRFSASELDTLKGLLMRMFQGLEALAATGVEAPLAPPASRRGAKQ